MPEKIGEHVAANGIKETWWSDADGNVTIQRSDDAQAALDGVAKANLDGLPTIDGLGKPLAEIPLVTAMAWAEQRGIPWEKLMYSHEYDAEFKRFIHEHSRLQYRALKSVHTIQ